MASPRPRVPPGSLSRPSSSSRWPLHAHAGLKSASPGLAPAPGNPCGPNSSPNRPPSAQLLTLRGLSSCQTSSGLAPASGGPCGPNSSPSQPPPAQLSPLRGLSSSHTSSGQAFAFWRPLQALNFLRPASPGPVAASRPPVQTQLLLLPAAAAGPAPASRQPLWTRLWPSCRSAAFGSLLLPAPSAGPTGRPVGLRRPSSCLSLTSPVARLPQPPGPARPRPSWALPLQTPPFSAPPLSRPGPTPSRAPLLERTFPAPASVFAGHPASRRLRAPPPPSATALAFPAPQASLGSGRLAARLSGRGWSGRPSQWGAAAAAAVAVAVAVAVAAVWDPDGLRCRQREAEEGGVSGSGGGRKVAAPVLLRVSVRRWERVTDMQCASPPGSCSPSAPTMWSWRRSGTTGPLRPGTVDEVLRRACLQVDIIPLITKADTISKDDLQMFKSKIMSELISSGIQIYQLPTDEETAAQANSSINMLLPFAVVGSMDEVKVAERMVRDHHYPWGVLQEF
ncbi:uncharacterized protein [Macaca fascicularis]|uniref:uncharacterized protein n=1 Tax=Macaca fascicularis TaxID=9541 RepID=UPI003D15BE85